MRKYFYVLAVLVLSLLAPSAHSQNKDPLKVGLILPLTGPLAEYGHAFQNGLTLAVQDSTTVAKNCNFIVEDSKYDAKTAVAAFQKLVSTDAVSVVYNWGGSTSEAVASLADRKDVAVFVWAADPKVAQGRKHVIRFSNSGADYGGTLAQFLHQQGYRKVGIVKAENQYIDAILTGLQDAAKGKLEVEVIDSYQPTEPDFRPTITKIKGKKFDALGVFLLSGQVSNFVNQLAAQQVKIPLFGTDFFESMTEVRQSHGGLVGSVFANNQVTTDFRDVYVKTYGNDLQINHAANGYDFAVFLCENVKSKLNDNSPDEVLARTVKIPSFAGKQGTAVFTTSAQGDRYFRFPVVIRRINADEIVTEKVE